MKKKIRLLALLTPLLIGVGVQSIFAATEVPQTSNPDACKASKQNREACKGWYELNERSGPDACQSSKQNREDCARWYAAGEAPPPPEKPSKAKPIAVLQGVKFRFNDSAIMPASYPILDKNLKLLKDLGNPDVRLVGHTDSVGSDAYNQKLSERRAASVKSYFVKKGYSGKIETEGKGEKEPIASNDTDEGRSQNRRVEVYKQ